MARSSKPWYWKARKTWCVYIDGKKHVLGPDKQAAKTQFHNLMGGQQPTQPVPTDAVAAVLDDFLAWTEENRSAKTFRGYLDFCQSFIELHGLVPVSEITAEQVTSWLKTKTTWNSTTKHNAVTCLKRAFNWAIKNRGLTHNPIAKMEKSKARTRTEILTLDEFKNILRHTPDREFRQLLRFCWETGCRPFETKLLERRHIDLEKKRCVIPASEGKKERLRVIYLPLKALVIIQRLMDNDGKLFRNKRGRPWTASAVKCRFDRLEETLGRRYFQYMFRHSWITRKLKAGVDSHIVGALAGHADTKMIDKVYSHVAEDHEFMLEQAERE